MKKGTIKKNIRNQEDKTNFINDFITVRDILLNKPDFDEDDKYKGIHRALTDFDTYARQQFILKMKMAEKMTKEIRESIRLKDLQESNIKNRKKIDLQDI